MPEGLICLCPHCGSGDIRWCCISVRPYCLDCGIWAPVNFGPAEQAVREWNERVAKAHELPPALPASQAPI